jgi:hypothetical protein
VLTGSGGERRPTPEEERRRMSDVTALPRTGGPKTEEGKEVVRWNATRHGISSPAPVVPGLERSADWEEHREGILENLFPVGHLELTLAERVALLSWRLHRVTRYETEVIALSQEKVEEDIHDRRWFAFALGKGSINTHPEDVRFQAKHDKQTHYALRRFSSHDAEKVLKAEDTTSVVWGVLVAAQKKIGEEIDVERLDLPGVPEDAFIEELPAMRAADVRGCVETIAAHASMDPEELLEAATKSARQDAVSSEYEKAAVAEEISRKSRERILPDDKTLEKVARYEAHLSRQLYQALHELEALQSRRLGGNAPLARLDVQGLPGS